jgi:hypothetical protein
MSAQYRRGNEKQQHGTYWGHVVLALPERRLRCIEDDGRHDAEGEDNRYLPIHEICTRRIRQRRHQ